MAGRGRKRDHHAENVRRNELARLRGTGRNRYEERKKIESGLIQAIRPAQVRALKTVKAQKEWRARAAQLMGVDERLIGGYKIPSVTERCQDWSDQFARASAAVYAPHGVDSGYAKMCRDHNWPVPRSIQDMGITEEQYTRAYFRAFVDGNDRYDVQRHNGSGGSYAMWYWFVVLNEYLLETDYEARYGPADY